MASTDTHYITVATPKAGADILVDVPKITLEWKHVTKVVKVKNTATKQVEDKVILNDLSGAAVPGELVVMMGPSGAGKSSLLDVIAGRQKEYTGTVLANGNKWTKQMNKYASYVMQDDVFYETLTVKEHLLFQAELRMGKTFNASQREQRVNYVIEELGLEKCRDTQIGGGRIRGISGGQRKRLSFATEILTNPSLLFVDEPTSGLDSFMAESVIQMLQKLAREGRTVIATIHQPASELFVLFDKLVLLSDGQLVYNGKASEAVEYFASQGYPCPNYMNPTDYFMRQIIVLDSKSEAAARVQSLVSNWRGVAASDDSVAIKDDSTRASDDDDTVYESTHLGPIGQMRVLCKRNITRLVRDTLAFKARIGQSIVVSVVVGLIFWQLELSQMGIQSITGAIFFIVVNQFFSATTPEFATVPLELPIMAREYNGGLYRTYV
ncbi:ATP-binding Cassette (ABC) Superfamily, partial [Achlya hypogyna]